MCEQIRLSESFFLFYVLIPKREYIIVFGVDFKLDINLRNTIIDFIIRELFGIYPMIFSFKAKGFPHKSLCSCVLEILRHGNKQQQQSIQIIVLRLDYLLASNPNPTFKIKQTAK